MITVRRHSERQHRRHAQPETWRTFHPLERSGAVINAFGSLTQLAEFRLPPGTEIPQRPRSNAEKITYVQEGSLTYRDSVGQSGLLRGGDFQCRTSARDTTHTETNPSRSDWAHVFQVWLGPSRVPLQLGQVDRRFSAADRRGLLCIVASPDGRHGSLDLHQDAVVYSTLLDEGQHVVHALDAGRCAWLHVVQGQASVGDVCLAPGDGIGVSGLHALSVTALITAELLLIDLPDSALTDPARAKAGTIAELPAVSP